MIERFTFWRSYYDAFSSVDYETKCRCILNVLEYVFEGKAPEARGTEAAIFALMKPSLDISIQNGKNGRKNRNEIEMKSNENRNEIENENRFQSDSTTTTTTTKDIEIDKKIVVDARAKSILDLDDKISKEEYDFLQSHIEGYMQFIQDFDDKNKFRLEEIDRPFNYLVSEAKRQGKWRE